MKTDIVNITAGDSRYHAVVGRGLLERAGELLRDVVRAKRCAIIADENSAKLFVLQLQHGLGAEFESKVFTIAAGEGSKTLENVGRICDEMVAAGFDRSAFVIGLGGGVVGDVSGFVAAIFNRGIPHVQIPTTLLAMVDSSIGGKCGVNTGAGKNLLGAIHQPRLILCDLNTLDSLPERELRQGLAEIVKHAIIRDAEMFEMLQSFDRADLQRWIKRNIEIKAAIVAADERETNDTRAILNFGHTIGHAIERAGNYTALKHGEAISLGMIAAAHISVKHAMLQLQHAEAITQLLDSLGLPTKLPPEISRDEVCDAVRHDKKFVGGQIRFVVTPQVGKAFVSGDVTFDDIREAIAQL